MIPYFGLLLLLKSLAAEGCTANQSSTVTLLATEDNRSLENGTFLLPFNSTCQWNITAPVGKVLSIDAGIFLFHKPCGDMYLKIHDGPSELSSLISEYCLNVTFSTKKFSSSGRSVWIEAKKGPLDSYGGFLISYQAIPFEECPFNSTLNAPLSPVAHNISSPYWPLGHRLHATCGWYITAPENYTVVLHLKYKLSMDSVKVYDVESSVISLLAHFTGRVPGHLYQATIYSNFRRLYILFESKIDTDEGFYASYSAVTPICTFNSTLNAPLSPVEHNFSSPSLPFGYRLNTTCGWYITAPENHTVVLRLTYKLYLDSVEIYDVEGSVISLIARFTARLPLRSESTTIYSKFRRLYIVFESKVKTTDVEEEFYASYSAISLAHACSSMNSLDENRNIVLKSPSGVITTPGYPSSYPQELMKQCFWKILAPVGNIVRADFLSFRLPSSRTCLTIFFAINKRNPTQTLLCGLKASFLLYSMTNEIGIEGPQSYGFNPGRGGFNANYTTIPAASSGVCIPSNNSTVHMAAEGMTFATPGFPLYPGKGRCNWNISVPEGNLIKLTFLSLSTRCTKSYVAIFDTTNSTRIPLGKFCDVTSGDFEVYSRGSSLLVTYVNLLNTSASAGFLATYETVKAIPAKYACGKLDIYGIPTKLGDSFGEFASHQFPRSYSNDVKCSWIIQVPVGFLVNLTFHTFELQESPGCSADHVEIKQGKSVRSVTELLGRFCGASVPRVIQSNRSIVRVDFVADSSGRYPGFHASFKAVSDPAMGPCKTQGLNNVIPLNGKTGRLFSPLYPETFPNNMTCTWIIAVTEGHFVRLRITSFFLAHVCKQTTLEIRDGQKSSSDLLGNFCGSSFERSVFSSGRHLWIRFHSDKDELLYGTGFNAFFEMVGRLPAPFSCTAKDLNIKLKSETGTLASYNYPLPSDDSVECIWSISVDTNSKIILSFEFFNVSRTSDCSEDYLEVRDGMFSTSDLVGKYCGAEKPSKITSDSWNLRVAFKSSGKLKYPGFKATYKIKKDQTLKILKIVGICVGALSLLCTIVAGSCRCCNRRHNQSQPENVLAMQGTVNAGADGEGIRNQTGSS